MKKIIGLLITLSFMLSACSKPSELDAKMATYKAHYELIDQHQKFLKESSYFNVETEMIKQNGNYIYYIVVDQAKIEMHDVVLMVVENDQLYQNNPKMMPSAGIFDRAYSLIPKQINKDFGYMKGIIISGESKQANIKVELLVEWRNSRKELQREFLSLNIK